MKVNQQLMMRLSQSNINCEQFVKRMETSKKSVPEHFANSTSNFRVRPLTESKESPMTDSQLTRATTMQNSQMSSRSTLKQKILGAKDLSTMVQQKMQQSLRPAPMIRKLVPRVPTRTNTNENNEPQSLSNSFLANQSTVSITQNTPKIVTRMRGSSLLTKQQKPPLDQRPPSARKTTLSVAKDKIDNSNLVIAKKIDPKDLPIFESINEGAIQNLIENQDPHQVKNLVMRFDSSNDSLQELGELLPSLIELRLNLSKIPTIRDLGTRLQGLRILWINQSNLKDLSGINALPQLRELYCSFNLITDLSPIAFHENLELLDIEGNDISDIMQIDFIESLENLELLNISSNPIMITNTAEVKARLGRFISEMDETDQISDRIYQDGFKHFKYLDDSRVNQLYELAYMIMDDPNEVAQWEQQIKTEINNDLQDEPDEVNLIAHQLKTTKQTKQKKQSEHYDPFSSLIQTTESLCGNPLKAAKAARNQMRSEFDATDRKSMDIRNILKQFQK